MAEFSLIGAVKGGIISAGISKAFSYGMKRREVNEAILETLRQHLLDHEGKPTTIGEPVEVDHLVITITTIDSPRGDGAATPTYHVLVIRPDLPGDSPDRRREFFYDQHYRSLRHAKGI